MYFFYLLQSIKKQIKSTLDIFKKGEGFTLIEILIAVGLLTLIVSLGLILSMDFYRTYAFNYEKDLLVSLLQQARSRSMANINQLEHGVGFDTDEHAYRVFEGTSVQTFEANKAIEINWDEDDDVVFSQLEGACQTCSPTTITLSGFGKNIDIIINNQGRIDYE